MVQNDVNLGCGDQLPGKTNCHDLNIALKDSWRLLSKKKGFK